MIETKNKIIEGLFFKELQELIKKYSEMDNRTIDIINTINLHVKDEDLKEYLLSSENILKELTEYYKDKEISVNEMIFYAWYNLNIEKITIKENSVAFMDLEEDGCIELDEYLIYNHLNDLRNYTIDKLDSMLDLGYHVDRLLDKDKIIEYWLEEVDKPQAINDIMENYEINEILDIDPEYCFTDENGIEYKYANIKQ